MTVANRHSTHAGHEAYCKPKSDDVVYFGAGGVIAAELESIRERRKLPSDAMLDTRDLRGLALSGGGIRSASFSLGVMQALAHNGWLAKIDYLSTVSGGGYIGSSLTWAINSDPRTFGLKERSFPFASFPMSGEARDEEERTPIASVLNNRTEKVKWSGRLLNFLRQNASYLTPGKGLNLFALVWIALRGAGLGLLVYGALITLVFLLAFQFNLLQEVCALPLLPKALKQNWFLLASILGFGCCALTLPLYSLATYLYRWARGVAYPFRRGYERAAGWLLPVILALLLLGIVPLVHDWVVAKGDVRTAKAGHFTISGNLTEQGALSFDGTVNATAVTEKSQPSHSTPCASPCPEIRPPEKGSLWANIRDEVKALGSGLGTLLVGLLSGVMAFLKTKSTKPGKVPLGLLVSVGVVALLFGIILFAYTVASAVVETFGCNTAAAWRLIVISLVVTLFFAILTNINHISIHRYYHDRLMETFMPDVDRVLNADYARAAKSSGANIKPLHAMTHGPYHIVNTNVVLASSDKPKFRVRGGDNFILSPQYCGSYATGWQSTKTYMKGNMTLASAMAISGAALNPSAGCGGEGITRSPALSVLMGLLNFRLGYWVPNPKNSGEWRAKLRNPNFLLPGLWEVLFRQCLNEKRAFLQLSDGGHFENLALYELVRRKLRLIIVCDGGADPNFSFSDLANAMEKVRTDFGALIMINNKDLKTLIPKKSNNHADADQVNCADTGHLVAKIKYADNSEGILIYLTTTFFSGVSADLYGYKKEHPAFPDEPTGDQFFDEKQFEAYRELGFQAAWKMMHDVINDAEAVKRVWPKGPPERG